MGAGQDKHTNQSPVTPSVKYIKYTFDKTYPDYWGHGRVVSDFKDAILLPMSEGLSNSVYFRTFQGLLDNTFHAASTRDRPCPLKPRCSMSQKQAGGCQHCWPMGTIRPNGARAEAPYLPIGYRVCQVLRIEDSERWGEYMTRHHEIKDIRKTEIIKQQPTKTCEIVQQSPTIFKPLDRSVNEVYLMHGSNTRVTLKIASEHIRLGKIEGGLGPGHYMAECSTKADEYASDAKAGDVSESDEYYEGMYAILVMRATLGNVAMRDQFFSDDEKTHVKEQVLKNDYDSVIVDRSKAVATFREFCIYDTSQAYTEYVILYRRVYEDKQWGVPKNPTRFQVPSYWHNFHKNPCVEEFEGDYDVRPLRRRLIETGLQLMSGRRDLTFKKARLMESSTILQKYVQTKLAIRERLKKSGASIPPGEVQHLVIATSAFERFKRLGTDLSLTMEHLETDLNEFYFWFGIQPIDNQIPDVHVAALNVPNEVFADPIRALRDVKMLADGTRAVFLCRVACGHLCEDALKDDQSQAAIVREGTDPLKFRLLVGPEQIYPEIFLHVQTTQRFVWHDPNIHSQQNKEIMKLFSNVGFKVTPFTEFAEAIEFLDGQDRREEPWAVLTSGTNGEQLVEVINALKCVKAVLVFCGNVDWHRKWAAKYDKVLDVFNEAEILVEKVSHAFDHAFFE